MRPVKMEANYSTHFESSPVIKKKSPNVVIFPFIEILKFVPSFWKTVHRRAMLMSLYKPSLF